MSLAAPVRGRDSGGVSFPPDDFSPAATRRPALEMKAERRASDDRRNRFWWSLLYGSFNPRRRNARRSNPGGLHVTDWHSSHLLAPVLAILVLCVCDAFLTLVLLQAGAHEANPVMARVVYGDATQFTAVKMIMTGCSVAVMVLLAGHRFLGTIRVEVFLYLIMSAYLLLVGYEVWLLRRLGGELLQF